MQNLVKKCQKVQTPDFLPIAPDCSRLLPIAVRIDRVNWITVWIAMQILQNLQLHVSLTWLVGVSDVMDQP